MLSNGLVTRVNGDTLKCAWYFTSFFKWHEFNYSYPEISSKKIIVEANTALLSLKKDSGIVKGSKWPDDGAVLTQEGPECPKNWTETTK